MEENLGSIVGLQLFEGRYLSSLYMSAFISRSYISLQVLQGCVRASALQRLYLKIVRDIRELSLVFSYYLFLGPSANLPLLAR